MVNIRQKGQNGERQIATLLNGLIILKMREMGFSEDKVVTAATAVQRNQNQSAVGGNDLSNTFGLSIEVKCQEQLAINTWWAQCVTAAERNNEIPVLIFKQNHKGWRVITMGEVPLPDNNTQIFKTRVEFTYDEFARWFSIWVGQKLSMGEAIRT